MVVFHSPLAQVWSIIRGMKFNWWSLVSKVSCNGAADQVGQTHTIVYKV